MGYFALKIGIRDWGLGVSYPLLSLPVILYPSFLRPVRPLAEGRNPEKCMLFSC